MEIIAEFVVLVIVVVNLVVVSVGSTRVGVVQYVRNVRGVEVLSMTRSGKWLK